MKRSVFIFVAFVLLMNTTPVLAKKPVKKKNLPYVEVSSPDFDKQRHSLDVVAPSNETNCDVVIFVHGGSWRSGSKNVYRIIGKNFAEKRVVFVSINYRLSPSVKYKDMAYDVARAVKWVQQNIEQYGGNPDRIFLSGHSSGGYLAALVGLDPEYMQKAGLASNSIKGLVLIDAFCLDLYDFFTITDPEFAKRYYPIFGSTKEEWELATPAYYINNANLPMQAFIGKKTYPEIMFGTDRFRTYSAKAGKKVELKIIKGKKHIGMITQMFFRKNEMFNYIIDFMNRS